MSGRLEELLADVNADELESAPQPAADGQAFFTARVLDTLPEPLAWTGVTPRVRVATLLAFHIGAAIVAYFALQWAAPGWFADLEVVANDWVPRVSTGPESTAMAACAVLVVAAVAFWATRSHTRAT